MLLTAELVVRNARRMMLNVDTILEQGEVEVSETLSAKRWP